MEFKIGYKYKICAKMEGIVEDGETIEILGFTSNGCYVKYVVVNSTNHIYPKGKVGMFGIGSVFSRCVIPIHSINFQ